MRKCITEEFNSIYIYHLKGNARTQGVQRQKEKDNVFGEGSRAPVAIVFLVKNPRSSDRGKIYFHAVDDYLTREEKLAALKRDRSISNTSMNVIVPDAHGDWFNQRDDSFSHFMRMDGKKTKEVAIFKDYSLGVNTNRDAWVYNSSRQTVIDSTKRSVLAFNKALGELNSGTDASSVRQKYIKDVAWSSSLVFRLERKIPSDFSERRIQKSLYRPFFKQNLYFDPESGFTHRPGRWRYIFPDSKAKNLAICSSGVGSKCFTCLMAGAIADLNMLEAGLKLVRNASHVGFPVGKTRGQKTHSTLATRMRSRAVSLQRLFRTSKRHIPTNLSQKMISSITFTEFYTLRTTGLVTPIT